MNPNLFRITTSVSGLQLVLWCYLSYFALTELDPLVKQEGKSSSKQQRTAQEGDRKGDTAQGGAERDVEGETGDEGKDRIGNQQLMAQENPSQTDSAEQAIQGDAKRDLKEGEETTKKEEEGTLFKWFMSSKWRVSLSLLSLGVGTVFALTAYIYPLRMVRSLTYIRPRQSLEVVTYTPWGSTRSLEVPLLDVACNSAPHEAQLARGQSIALKIKDYPLYFLLNPGGAEVNPMLKTLVLSRKN